MILYVHPRVLHLLQRGEPLNDPDFHVYGNCGPIAGSAREVEAEVFQGRVVINGQGVGHVCQKCRDRQQESWLSKEEGRNQPKEEPAKCAVPETPEPTAAQGDPEYWEKRAKAAELRAALLEQELDRKDSKAWEAFMGGRISVEDLEAEVMRVAKAERSDCASFSDTLQREVGISFEMYARWKHVGSRVWEQFRREHWTDYWIQKEWEDDVLPDL